jgi:hypothetical protein
MSNLTSSYPNAILAPSVIEFCKQRECGSNDFLKSLSVHVRIFFGIVMSKISRNNLIRLVALIEGSFRKESR